MGDDDTSHWGSRTSALARASLCRSPAENRKANRPVTRDTRISHGTTTPMQLEMPVADPGGILCDVADQGGGPAGWYTDMGKYKK